MNVGVGVRPTQLTNRLNFLRKGAEAQRRNYNYCFFTLGVLASWREYNRDAGKKGEWGQTMTSDCKPWGLVLKGRTCPQRSRLRGGRGLEGLKEEVERV